MSRVKQYASNVKSKVITNELAEKENEALNGVQSTEKKIIDTIKKYAQEFYFLIWSRSN